MVHISKRLVRRQRPRRLATALQYHLVVCVVTHLRFHTLATGSIQENGNREDQLEALEMQVEGELLACTKEQLKELMDGFKMEM